MGRTDTNFGPTEGSSEATMQAGCHIYIYIQGVPVSSQGGWIIVGSYCCCEKGALGGDDGPHSRYGLSHTRATLQSHRHYSGMGWGNERNNQIWSGQRRMGKTQPLHSNWWVWVNLNCFLGHWNSLAPDWWDLLPENEGAVFIMGLSYWCYSYWCFFCFYSIN